MKLGILGGTSLANALGEKYLDAGASVVFGVGGDFDIEVSEWKTLNRIFNRICPFESAIIQSEFILVCCQEECLIPVCAALKNVDLSDKILIDCTNANNPQNTNHTTRIVESASKAAVFRAFNDLGIDCHPSDLYGIKETNYWGEAIPEKNRVKRLIELIGFRAIDAGRIHKALALE